MSGSNSSVPPVSVKPPELLEPLVMSVHGITGPALHDPVASARSRTALGRLRMLLVLLVCAAPVIASYMTYFVIRPEGRSNYGTLIAPSRSLPEDMGLRTLEGAAVPARSLRGQWLLVTVGPSACDDACDKRLFTQRQLREMLGRERDRVDKVWLVTDNGPLSPALRAATQAPMAVTVLRADALAVARWLAPAQGHTLQEHLYVVDPMGEWMMRLPAQPDPSRAKRDLDRVLRASAFWDTPGR